MISFKLFRNGVIPVPYKGKTYNVRIENGVARLKAKGKTFRAPSPLAEAVTGHPTSGLAWMGLVDYRTGDRSKLEKVLKPEAKSSLKKLAAAGGTGD